MVESTPVRDAPVDTVARAGMAGMPRATVKKVRFADEVEVQMMRRSPINKTREKVSHSQRESGKYMRTQGSPVPGDRGDTAVVDTACAKTVVGRSTLEAISRRLITGLKIDTYAAETRFSGVGGSTKSTTVALIPVGIGGRSGVVMQGSCARRIRRKGSIAVVKGSSFRTRRGD